MWGILTATILASAGAAAPPHEQTLLLRDAGEPALSVHHEPGSGPSVLYVHGATFPAALSINYRIDGKSWADDLHARGFDVWSFDFAGYGGSDQPDSMQLASVPRDKVPGRAAGAAHQIERVVRYIRAETRHPQVSIIAHSWGTIPAGLFAGTHPDWVHKLLLFGPVARREGNAPPTRSTAPTILVSASDQWEGFQTRVPGPRRCRYPKIRFDAWVQAYLASDPTSAQRTPPSARAPAGPVVDIHGAWNGQFPYDPAIVRTPTLIVRGEWDNVTRDADAAWLAKAMKNVPGGVQDVKLPRGAHRMHLEENRQALFDAAGDFLQRTGR